MPHYVNERGLLCHTSEPLEVEWPAVFVTGVLQPASTHAYIIQALEGFRLRDLFPHDCPKPFTAGLLQLAHAVGIQPNLGAFRRCAEVRGIDWRRYA